MIPSTSPNDREAAIAQAVPRAARRVLVVGRPTDSLAAALRSSGRETIVEDPQAAVASGSFDAVVYPDALHRLDDPEATLGRHRRLIGRGGTAVAAVRNARHYRSLLALLGGEWPSAHPDAGAGPRPFTLAAAQRLFLDAGYAPDLAAVLTDPTPPDVLSDLAPALRRVGAVGGRDRLELNATDFIVRAFPVAGADDPPRARPVPLTFVACVSDDEVLRANLLASPDLGPGSPHEVILVRNCPSAAHGLNVGLDRGRHDPVVGVHQDVYLPRGWVARFARRWDEAVARFGRVGVAGVYGIAGRGADARRAGHVVDRVRLLREALALPAAVDSLDELLVAVRRDAGVRFDPALGFHLYGTDICLEAARRGWAAVALDAPCLHHSRGEGLPADFSDSVTTLARKWAAALPLATPCVRIDPGGRLAEW